MNNGTSPRNHQPRVLFHCPACGSTNVHQDRVEVFERREDADHGLHVTVLHHDRDDRAVESRDDREGTYRVDTSLQGNPSGRRHGVRIEFWCEQCPTRSLLTIAQHKGETRLACVPIVHVDDVALGGQRL